MCGSACSGKEAKRYKPVFLLISTKHNIDLFSSTCQQNVTVWMAQWAWWGVTGGQGAQFTGSCGCELSTPLPCPYSAFPAPGFVHAVGGALCPLHHPHCVSVSDQSLWLTDLLSSEFSAVLHMDLGMLRMSWWRVFLLSGTEFIWVRPQPADGSARPSCVPGRPCHSRASTELSEAPRGDPPSTASPPAVLSLVGQGPCWVLTPGHLSPDVILWK